jgi:hypothetical protein
VRGPLEAVAGIVVRDVLGRGQKHGRRHKLISRQSIAVPGSENRAESRIYNDPTPFHEHLGIHMLGALVRIQQQYSADRQFPLLAKLMNACVAEPQTRGPSPKATESLGYSPCFNCLSCFVRLDLIPGLDRHQRQQGMSLRPGPADRHPIEMLRILNRRRFGSHDYGQASFARVFRVLRLSGRCGRSRIFLRIAARILERRR